MAFETRFISTRLSGRAAVANSGTALLRTIRKVGGGPIRSMASVIS
jgi:hypothetical protein